MFLLQMLTFGETIEFPLSNTDYASPLQPLKNIYLPHVMLLAKTKMRIGKNIKTHITLKSLMKSFYFQAGCQRSAFKWDNIYEYQASFI